MDINETIKEELNKTDVKKMIDDKVSAYCNSDDFKKRVVNITADVLEKFLDDMWAKKGFWKSMIKR